MKIYNKFGVFRWSDYNKLPEDEKEKFYELFEKILNLGNKTKHDYLVINQDEKFAPAVKELIKAYCD